MIRLRGVRVDPGDHLMYVRLLKIPGNYCLVLLCQIVPVLFDMAYSALKTPDSNLDCSRLSLEQGDYHLSDKVVLRNSPRTGSESWKTRGPKAFSDRFLNSSSTPQCSISCIGKDLTHQSGGVA